MKIIRLKRQLKGIVRVVFRIGTIVGLVLALYVYQIGGTNAQSTPGASNTSSYIHEQLDENGINTLTICDWDDSSKCITMQDKNLGASEAGVGCINYANYCYAGVQYYSDMEECLANDNQLGCMGWEYFGNLFTDEEDCNDRGQSLYEACMAEQGTGMYGKHFQWGNNHGFEIGCFTYGYGCTDTVTNSATGTLALWSPEYNHVGYNGATFIKGTSSSRYDYWSDNTPSNHNGLRGGENDTAENNYGFDETNNVATNVGNRRGPCGEGYHVPSIGEWNKVLEYWAEENGIELEDDGGLKSTTLDVLKFQEDFKIPFAGFRISYEAKVYHMEDHANFWSSSPRVGFTQALRFTLLSPGQADAVDYHNRADALSLRCFKDSPLSFSSVVAVKVVDGKNVLYKGEIVPGSKISDNAGVMAILNQDMTKNGYIFLGWYDEDGEEIDLNLIPTKNTKIIAKWRADYIYEKKVKGINTLTICDPNDSTSCITMKDRNEGATIAGTECSELNSGACGYHFQRGNNHGFAPCLSDSCNIFPNGETKDGHRVDCEGYGPTIPFEDSIFRAIRYDDYCLSGNDNMWGGSGDSPENDRGYPLTLQQAENRRGPCDTGYHVPSIGEWNQLLEYWAKENEINFEYYIAPIEPKGLYNSLKGLYNSLKGLYDDSYVLGLKFQEDFKVPFAGYRDYYAFAGYSDSIARVYIGELANLWSSSPYSYYRARVFGLSPDGVSADRVNVRSYAFSVRCFKDSPLIYPFTVVVKVMDGNNVVWEGEVDTQQTLPEDVITLMLGHENTKVGYTFSGWYDDETDSWRNSENIVETGFTLRAVWTVNNYTVTVVSNNTNSGTVSSGGVISPYGATIISPSTNTVKIGDTTITATPKTQTAQWTYEFVDWTNTCGDTVTTGCTITANFTSTLNKYTVTWKNSDGTTLKTDTDVPYGTTPTYNGATPTSGGNAQYSYTFKGWTPSISSVTGNITYTATYTQNINKYTVTWKNSNGTILETDNNVPYGTIPTYDGATPTKPKDAQYTYVFTTWSPTITAVHGNQEYTAQFSNTTDNYTVTVVSNNTNSGTVTTGTITVPYGTSINTSSSILTIGSKTSTATPKTQTAQWTYEFVDWTNTCGNTISAGCTITANFKSTLRSYTIIWKDGDGVVVERDNNVPYGATPTYNGSTPTKTDTKQYTYTFSTWSPVISEVRGNQEYTAQFNSEGKDKGEDDISHHSADEIQYDASKYDSSYSYEMNQAYQYSYHYEITSKESISKADMTGKLTRIATAKMLSQYAINVLGMTPDTTKQVPFTDVSAKLDADYDNGVTLAYQLGIMGINMPNNEFRPYDTVSRAEFVTAFSRMRYGILDGKDVYYSTHMKLLYDLGIISNTNPSMKEIRGYVMLILMRSDKNN